MIKDKNKFNILVIEDNKGDFILVEMYLQKKIEEPIIKHVQTFSAAKTILQKEENSFDIILLDLSLPDKNGNQLITEILELAASTPVIVLTGYADIEFSRNSISIGISDYLLKDELNAMALYKSIIYAIERRKKIEELNDSEKRYSFLFHFSPLPKLVYDLETLLFVNVNTAAITLYGYTREEFLCLTIYDIVAKSDTDKLKTEIKFCREFNRNSHQGIYVSTKKNGDTIQVEAQSIGLILNNRKVNLVAVNDITERLNYIETIEIKNRKLAEIAWIQSHVVRAPLARMMGLIDILQNIENTQEEKNEFLTHILHSAKEFDTVIKDIMQKTEDVKNYIN